MTWKQDRPRRPRKMPYAPGTLFAVPLDCGGYAAGVVARVSKPSGALLGYYFGPRLEAPPAIEDGGRLRAPNAIYVSIGSDLHLLNGSWPIVGCIPGWNESEWPIPWFRNDDPLRGIVRRVTYSEDNLWSPLRPGATLASDESLPESGMAGSSYIEAMLADRLCNQADG